MSDQSLTGSEVQRFDELHDKWLVFEPISNTTHSLKNFLFSVPLGQTKAPIVIVNTGSVPSTSGVVTINKEIHLFDDETDASRFLTDLGAQNISAYKQVEIRNTVLGSGQTQRATGRRRTTPDKTLIEIHVIDYPKFNIGMSILDADSNLGYIVEPFISGSTSDPTTLVDLEPVTRNIRYNDAGRVVSDTYLRFFCLEPEKV